MSASTATPNDQQPAAGRISTSDRLWAALRTYPGSTTEQLAVHASIGQSTAGKILARWVADDSIARHAATRGSKGRGPATFTIAEPGDPITETAVEVEPDDATAYETPTDTAEVGDSSTTADPTNSDVASADDAGPTYDGDANAAVEPPSRHTAKKPRLSPGSLRGMIEDFLREHPNDDVGPVQIGKELGRSSGAVANALDRLVSGGYAVQTSDKPKRYRFVSSENQA
jgi:hypothetical protein